jgi:hypothetical protein
VGQVIAEKLAEKGEPGVDAREDRVRWQLAGVFNLQGESAERYES